MSFEITHINGEVLVYSFEPRHAKDAKKFYRSLTKSGKIAGWRVI